MLVFRLLSALGIPENFVFRLTKMLSIERKCSHREPFFCLRDLSISGSLEIEVVDSFLTGRSHFESSASSANYKGDKPFL